MKSGAALLILGVVGGGLALAASSAHASSGDDTDPIPPDSTDGPVFTVTASSGAVYEVHFVKSFDTESGKQSFWDVFDIQGRVLRYSQLEDDTNSRIFIVSPRGPNGPGVSQVMNDFGIRFEGGVVAIPASDTQPQIVPGQVLISAGEWLGTADIGFPKSLLVSASLIKAAMQEQGFTQVSVFTEAPKDWPISKNGNYFVQALWEGPPKIFKVPSEVVDLKSNALA